MPRGIPQDLKDIAGREFGSFTVIKEAPRSPTYPRSRMFECRCICGNIRYINMSNLRNRKSCGCLAGAKTRNWKGYGDLSKSQWRGIVNSAVGRGLSVEITIEDAWNLYEKQNRKCALSGVPLRIVTDITHRREENTASLDRIDSSLGYTIDNIQWVHKDVNFMKQALSQDIFLNWCFTIADHNRLNLEKY